MHTYVHGHPIDLQRDTAAASETTVLSCWRLGLRLLLSDCRAPTIHVLNSGAQAVLAVALLLWAAAMMGVFGFEGPINETLPHVRLLSP